MEGKNGDKSKVYFMCGPAGSGKSTLAQKFERQGMTVLSYDAESFKQGLIKHPLPDEVLQEIKTSLDKKSNLTYFTEKGCCIGLFVLVKEHENPIYFIFKKV